MSGFFVVVEGTDGVGKTAVVQRLKELVKGDERFVFTREPGGTEYAEDIRKVLFGHSTNAFSEVMLIQSARADHMEKVIRPALEADKIVVCDRFVHSTWAYNILPELAKDDKASYLAELFNYTNAHLLMGVGEPFTVIVTCSPEQQQARLAEKTLNRLDDRFKNNLELINEFYAEQSTTPNCAQLDNSGDLTEAAQKLLEKILQQKEHFDKHQIKVDGFPDPEVEQVVDGGAEGEEPKAPEMTLDEIKRLVREQACTDQFLGSMKEERELIENVFDFYVDKVEMVMQSNNDTLTNGKSIQQLVQQIQSLVWFGHQFQDLKKSYLEKDIAETEKESLDIELDPNDPDPAHTCKVIEHTYQKANDN